LAAARLFAYTAIVVAPRAAPERLRALPRLGARIWAFEPREVRHLILDDYELRYEILGGKICILNLWHTQEDR
jgi:hypothetical protein